MTTKTKEKKQEVDVQWVKVKDAAEHFGVSLSKIRSTMRNANPPVRNKKDAMDTRVRLVSLTDLQKIYERE
jgi:hypothetical protein